MADDKTQEEVKEEVKAEEAKEEVKETKQEKKGTKAVSGKVGKLVDEISTLSVLELSELVTALQDKLGVTAQAPVMQPPQGRLPPKVRLQVAQQLKPFS